MNKNTYLLPLACIIAIPLASCGQISRNQKKVTYTFIESCQPDTIGTASSIKQSLTFNWDWLVTYDTHEYHKDIAQAAAMITADTNEWFAMEFYEEDGSHNPGILLEKLGAKDVQRHSLHSDLFSTDINDACTVDTAHIEFTYQNQKYQTFILSVEGTATDREWISNFDIGNNGGCYGDAKDHPEWINKRHHKGYDIASRRTKEFFDQYMIDKADKEATPIILLTGYSRGGAVANLIGASYEDEGKKNFTYTFEASPGVETSLKKETNYKNIFNIVNSEDLVTYLPTPTMGFSRYGTDISLKVSDYANDYKNTFNRDYIAPPTDKIISLFDFCRNRNNMYTIPDKPFEEDISIEFTNKAECDEDRAELIELINRTELTNYIKVDESKLNNGSWTYSWRYAPSILIAIIICLFKGNIDSALVGISLINHYTRTLLPQAIEIVDEQGIFYLIKSIGSAHLPESFIEVVNQY